jgi:Ala-tRNA(Pro) deacylase
MTMLRKLAELLETREIQYRAVQHPPAFTAEDVALASGVPGRKLAKVVALRDRTGGWLLAVVPARMKVDLAAAEVESGRRGLRLASEAEIGQRFRDCELGAMIPLRQIHGVPVLLDDHFIDVGEIFFEDGTHEGLICMRMRAYLSLAHPLIAPVGSMSH